MNQSPIVMPNNKEMDVRSDTSLLEVDSARAVAQIQGAMMVAKKFPRDEVQAMNRIMAAAGRRKVAEQAEYEYSKGGSNIAGPSIRAAETISQAWGNMISGITEVMRDENKKESLMLAYAADMETNNWKFIEWRVPHTIDKTGGQQKALTSGRDIYERIMNDGSRRLRNVLLAAIPSDVTDSFIEKCNETLSKSDTPLKDRLSQMITAMAEFGVTQPMIENKMGCAYSAITERQLAQLRRIYQAIKDGFYKVSDYFKEADKAPKASSFNSGSAPAQENKPPVVTATVKGKVVIPKTEPTVMATEPAPEFNSDASSFENFQPGGFKTAEIKERDRNDLVLEVVAAAEKIGIKTLPALSARCMKDFGKKTSDMSGEELEILLTSLEKEKK